MQISDLQAYGFDFDDIYHNEKIGNIESKQVSEAKFIKLTLRHPMTSLLEVSYFYQQLNKPINYTLQFISCVGSVKVEEPVDLMLAEKQKESSLQMLSKFFQNQFQNTF